jgi:hypothetical protein
MEEELITALVTGANRGLGRQFAAGLVARGAKVYAAARRPETIDLPGVVPIQLDITDPKSVRRAADTATDITVLVNNAGISARASLLSGSLDDVRLEMEHRDGQLCPGGPEDRSRRGRHAGAGRPVRGRAGNSCRRRVTDREGAAVRQAPRALTNRHGRSNHQSR